MEQKLPEELKKLADESGKTYKFSRSYNAAEENKKHIIMLLKLEKYY